MVLTEDFLKKPMWVQSQITLLSVFVYEKAGRIAQWVTEFVAEHGDLSLVPGSHTVVAESQLPACCPLTSTHAPWSMCSHTYTQI